jgi:hypothetical protein
MMKKTKGVKIKCFDNVPTCEVSSIATQILANNTTLAYDLGDVKRHMFEHFPPDIATEWFSKLCQGLEPLTEQLNAREFTIKVIISR